MALERMSIGAVAGAADVNVETVRFYQRKGLLREPTRAVGGIRRYCDGDVARLRFIRAAQGLGFTLDEIRELLTLDDGTHCNEARELASRKLTAVREKLKVLRRMESALADLVRSCQANPGRVRCPMVDKLRAHSERP